MKHLSDKIVHGIMILVLILVFYPKKDRQTDMFIQLYNITGLVLLFYIFGTNPSKALG